LAEASIEEICALGITKARASTVLGLSQAVASGKLSLEQAIDPENKIEQLKQLPGIGDWTAHYLAMRVLNWPDAFPHSDLGIRKALCSSSDRKILELAESWRPWRSYAAMHLWKSLEV
jgi:AraC family transcriptional regulator of adaptative response / DNA-3-methyladenine glycosylase II